MSSVFCPIDKNLPVFAAFISVRPGLPHLPAARYLVLRRGQFRQGERVAAVQFLCADAHFRAEAEFSAV